MNVLERARFEIRPTPGRGKGLFAKKPIRKGAFVIEYTGTPLPTKVADEMSNRYLFDMENGTTIDGTPLSNTARWINHSCDPNCEAFIEDGKIMIYACKNINEGEELSFDYGQEYFDEFLGPEGCLCGAKKHRKYRASPKASDTRRASEKA